MKPPNEGKPIEPAASRSALEPLVLELLGTRKRDHEGVLEAHRKLVAASPDLHRRLLAWFADREPDSVHLVVGLALAATSPDPESRRFARALLARMPFTVTADVIDYIHGWYVDHVHRREERHRYADEMSRAYAAGAGVVREALRRDGEQVDREFVGGEILVTIGEYDKVQQVLDHLQLPYRTIPCQVVHRLPLRADQTLVVNCPGRFSTEGIEAIRDFVACGGTLITTDWALKTTLQPAFPEVVRWNDVSTKDDVVPVSWVHPESVYTKGVEVPGQTISWWLEGASYPIRLLDPRVTVLMSSAEMERRYGEDPLVVTFGYGEGTVFHLTSHYYLQRSQGDRSAKAGDVAASLGVDASALASGAAAVSGSQLAAAYSSMRLLANVLYERRRACGV